MALSTRRLRRRRHAAIAAASAVACALALPIATRPTAQAAVISHREGPAPVAADAPWTKTVTYLVSQLTPAEKVKLIHGDVTDARFDSVTQDADTHGGAGYFPSIPRLGIPELRHDDAQGIWTAADATAGPSRIGLSASFSRELVGEFGTMVGKEGAGLGADLLYGPQADLARTPSWSRNNTAYSEDAYLATQLMNQEISHIQGQGLMAEVKHVGMYNGQNQSTPSKVDGQAAHEIYLAPAEAAAADGVAGMMCSYATFQIKDDLRYSQPDYACANKVLLTDIIKGDWNYKGFITSDYGGAKATSNITTGLDQEFSTSFLNAANLQPLIDSKSAQYDPAYEAAANEAIARSLYEEERFHLLDNDHIPAAYQSDVPQYGDVDHYDNTITVDEQAGIKLAEKLSERAAVLLKNEASVLPLSSSTSVNVVGQTSTLLPAAPGGEKSIGFGDRTTISPLAAMKGIGGSKVTSNPGIDLLGTTVPGATFSQNADGSGAGLVRTATAPGGTPTTSTVTSLDGAQTDLVRGTTYTYTGYINVPADDTYQLDLQRPYGVDTGDATKYNQGIKRKSGGTVSLSIDGANKTLANPDSNILQNAVPTFASGTANTIVAKNGQYLGYDNTGAAVALTAGRHAISITYTPVTNLAASPTLRLAWSGKNAAVARAVAAASTNDVSVIFADDSGSTGGDGASTSTAVLSLSAAQNSLITQVTAAAHAAGKKVVVVLNTGSAIQMPWVNQVDGVMEMWYPGQEGGTATAKLLYGKANPSGHLTISFPKSSTDTLFGVTDTNGDGVIGAGDANWERSNATKDADESVASLKWTEGLDIGYRWFTDPAANTKDVSPMFAFGHGLSYTDYAYSDLSTKPTADGGIDVSFTVKNTGSMSGYAAPQVYVGPSADLAPAKFEQTALKLAQFDSVELAPAESRTATLHIDARTLSSYSTATNSWVLGTGARTVYLGAASDDLRLQSTAKVGSGVTPPVVSHTAPAVTQQPAANVRTLAGRPVTLSAAATGDPDPEVRWQQSTDGGVTWHDIADATSTNYTFVAKASGSRYRAAFTNDLGTAYSSTSVVTVVRPQGASHTSVALARKKVTTKQPATVRLKVTPTASKPTGTVTIHVGKRTFVAHLPTSGSGVLSVKLPTLAKGTYQVSAVYSGDAALKGSTSNTVKLKVVKP